MDLQKEGIWSEAIKNKIILNDGSVQGIDQIPQRIQNIYKTAFEMSNRVYIDMSADRYFYFLPFF
jgi:ribonucleotide reductase alpha subunit